MKNFFNTLNFGLDQNLNQYMTAIIIFAALLGIFALFNKIVLKKLEKLSHKTKTDLDETLVLIVRKIKPPFYAFLAFYFALKSIEISEFFWKILTIILTVWVVYQIVLTLNILVDYAIKKYSEREENEGTKSAIKLIGRIVKGVLWVVATLFALSNFGINVTSLVAGLGIGGIAIALALQSVLSDLFSSFSIYFDKPFVPGDFITIGDEMGVVEYIGVKTTRLRALQGEEIVISNQELTNARIHNFKKLQERRVVFAFGLTYDTSNEMLQKTSKIVKEIIESNNLTRFSRVHFKAFSDSSLDFEVVYYAESSDYNAYMDAHQRILLEIKGRLEKEGIEMAFPTRTVYLKKD